MPASLWDHTVFTAQTGQGIQLGFDLPLCSSFSHVERVPHVLPKWGCAASPCRWGKASLRKRLPAHLCCSHYPTILPPPPPT